MVAVTFKIGSNLEDSKVQVADKVSSDEKLMALGVKPTVQQIDPENVPILTLALTSDSIDENGLREFASDLKEELKNVDGVSNIEINGGKKKQINIFLNNKLLESKNISSNDVINVIKANNFKLENLSLENHQSNIPITLDANVSTADQLKLLVVGGSGTRVIYLEDVAEVVDGFEVDEKFVTLDSFKDNRVAQKNAVYVSLSKVQGTNISVVSENVKSRLEKLEERFVPENIELQITRDEGEVASEEIMTLTEHLLLAILIVTVTLYFFLGMRIAFVVATAIPLTLALKKIAPKQKERVDGIVTISSVCCPGEEPS